MKWQANDVLSHKKALFKTCNVQFFFTRLQSIWGGKCARKWKKENDGSKMGEKKRENYTKKEALRK